MQESQIIFYHNCRQVYFNQTLVWVKLSGQTFIIQKKKQKHNKVFMPWKNKQK